MKDIERLIANIQFDVDTGWDFFKAVDFEAGVGIGPEIQHVELGNGEDAITSRKAEGLSCMKIDPSVGWDLETVWTFAQEFRMKVVALQKHDFDSAWDMTDNFDDLDCTLDFDENGHVTQKEYLRLARMLDLEGDPFADVPEYSKGLNVIDHFKDIENAIVFDTVDDVEKAYNEYTANLKDEYAYDQDTLHEELDKAQKSRDKIIEQVKRKSPSEFVMIPCSADFDADYLEIMSKFSTMFYDGYNQVSYALGLIPKEE